MKSKVFEVDSEGDSISSGSDSLTMTMTLDTEEKKEKTKKSFKPQQKLRDHCSLCCLDQGTGVINLHLDDICEEGCMICKNCVKSTQVYNLLTAAELFGRKCPICRGRLLDLKVLLGSRRRAQQRDKERKMEKKLKGYNSTVKKAGKKKNRTSRRKQMDASLSSFFSEDDYEETPDRDPALDGLIFDAVGELKVGQRAPTLRMLVRHMVKARDPYSAMLTSKRGSLRKTPHDKIVGSKEQMLKQINFVIAATAVFGEKKLMKTREREVKRRHNRAALGLSTSFTAPELMDFIGTVYGAKADHDDMCDLNNGPRLNMPAFVIKHIKEHSGSQVHMQDGLLQVIDSVEKYATTLPRVKVFGILTGLLVEHPYKPELVDLVLELLRYLMGDDQEMNHGSRIKRRLTNKRVPPTATLAVAYKALETMSTTGRFAKNWLMSSLRPVCTELGMPMPWEGKRMEDLRERIKFLSMTSSQRLHKGNRASARSVPLTPRPDTGERPLSSSRVPLSPLALSKEKTLGSGRMQRMRTQTFSATHNETEKKKLSLLSAAHAIRSAQKLAPLDSMFNNIDPEKLYVDVDKFIDVCISGWLDEEKYITSILGQLMRPFIKLQGGRSSQESIQNTPPPNQQEKKAEEPTLADKKGKLIYKDTSSAHLNKAKELAKLQKEETERTVSLVSSMTETGNILASRQPSLSLASQDSILAESDDNLSVITNETGAAELYNTLVENNEDVDTIDWDAMKKSATKSTLIPNNMRHYDAVKLSRKMGVFIKELRKGPWRWQRWKWLEEWEWGGLVIDLPESEECFKALEELGESDDESEDDDQGLNQRSRETSGSSAYDIDDKNTGMNTPYGFDSRPASSRSYRDSLVPSRHESIVPFRHMSKSLTKAITLTKLLPDDDVTLDSAHGTSPSNSLLSMNKPMIRTSSAGNLMLQLKHMNSTNNMWKSTQDIIEEQQTTKPRHRTAPPTNGGKRNTNIVPQNTGPMPLDINMSHFSVGDKNATIIAQEISKSKSSNHIQSLNLEGNKLNGQGTAAILRAVADSPQIYLSHLNVSNNKLNEEGVSSLKRILLHDKSSLTYLNLSDTNLRDAKADVICKALCTHKTLKILNLSKNNIQGKSLAISEMISENFRIQELNLSWNEIRSTEASSIFKSLEVSNMTITDLDMSYNPFGNSSATELADMLTVENSVLCRLNISYTGLGASSASTLARVIECTSLLYLNLNGNPLGMTGVEMIKVAGRAAKMPGGEGLEVLTENCSTFESKQKERKTQMEELYKKFNFDPNIQKKEAENKELTSPKGNKKEGKGGKGKAKSKKKGRK